MADLTWFQNDRPMTHVQLTRNSDGKAYDVSDSDASVSVLFRKQGNTTASLWTETLTKVKSDLGIMNFRVPADGLADDDVPEGLYELEFTLTEDGFPVTIDDVLTVRVKAEFPAVA